MGAAQLLVDLLAAYGALGALFAAAFVSAGIGRVDPNARHSPLGFRLMVMPGAAALWPVLLVRWIQAVRR